MALQTWEITSYQCAAEQMCFRLNENPYDQCIDSQGEACPRWIIYAQRMAEFRVMADVMRQFGALL